MKTDNGEWNDAFSAQKNQVWADFEKTYGTTDIEEMSLETTKAFQRFYGVTTIVEMRKFWEQEMVDVFAKEYPFLRIEKSLSTISAENIYNASIAQ